MGSSQDIWNRFEKWCRLAILIQEGGENVCKHIIYTEMKVPEGGKKMYWYLKRYETRIEESQMLDYQKEALLPFNKCINKKKLDIALFTFIIEILDNPVKPKYPRIKNLRFMRNELFHMREDQRNMSKQKFDDHWDEVSKLLTELTSTFNITTWNSFKSDNLSLDPCKKKTLEDILYEGSVK